MSEISDIVKGLRENNRLKQREVADYLGISQQAYSYYELDKRELPARHVVNLAKLYNVSTDYILGIEPDFAGSYDLTSKYIQDISLKDMLWNLKKLNKVNRQEAVKYLAYLNNTQSKQTQVPKPSTASKNE
ncbi:helix-turn-helix domain-containing protein [Kineothrix sp. MB12-C1]|uniref:helix-turn-helix domain-containing protein n=1 Tax=Kineothrix sp. MB12-C1 TaxID=3070215 RepID=UPI0027D2C9C3|nr:helix-turn-helix transcriptional regulator [Kineothrix sp. MB12-C1]WMC92488.1 helix-turn-helix transcriptional regulator [Kineothrix sp. MB12-C1]